MQRTAWCLISTLNAWPKSIQILETGAVTSRYLWRERVCMKYSDRVVCIGDAHISSTLCKCFYIFFYFFSGIWILVWPRERLVEEETDLSKPPLHLLWRSYWGNLFIFARCLYLYLCDLEVSSCSHDFSKVLLAFNNMMIIFDRCISRILDGK